jgi:hypothetical protein
MIPAQLKHSARPIREKGRVFDDLSTWPPEISGYAALLDLVHWTCERLNPSSTFLAYQRLPWPLFVAAALQLRRDALAGKFTLGIFYDGQFMPLDPAFWFTGWLGSFESGRTPEGADIFVLDRKLDVYLPQLSRAAAARLR